MASRFLISIVNTKTRDTVYLKPGGAGERDFIADVVARCVAKGVGVFRTEAHVKADIESAFEDALKSLKSEVLPPR